MVIWLLCVGNWTPHQRESKWEYESAALLFYYWNAVIKENSCFGRAATAKPIYQVCAAADPMQEVFTEPTEDHKCSVLQKTKLEMWGFCLAQISLMVVCWNRDVQRSHWGSSSSGQKVTSEEGAYEYVSEWGRMFLLFHSWLYSIWVFEPISIIASLLFINCMRSLTCRFPHRPAINL